MLEVILYLLMVVGIGVWASRWDRSVPLFVIVAVLLSPIVGAIALLITGKKAAFQKFEPQSTPPVIVNVTFPENQTGTKIEPVLETIPVV